MEVKPDDGRAARRGEPPFLLVAAVLGAVAASRFLAIAAEPGEIDEAVFSGAVLRYDLFELSPQAPGFPVWILLGRLLHLAIPSPFNALAVAATLLSALAFPALYVWGRRLVGGWAALSGVLFAASLPVIWVNGGRAFSDTPGTAFLLLSLASLTVAGEWMGRRASYLALAAGLAAAAGVGVRPHLVLAFGPVLLLMTIRLFADRARRATGAAFVLSGLVGTLGWLVWLTAQAGGPAGLLASLRERADYRAQAFATGVFGTLQDSFLVRDFLSPRRAIVVFALALVGLAALAVRRRRSFADLALVLVPAFLSLWFLHSRAMSRYSVPLVLVLGLAVGAGAAALLRRGVLGFAASVALAALFAPEAYREARWGATHETPPIAAIRHLERTLHAGRETIVADDDFPAFLRLERWEGRLWGWGLDQGELARARASNARLIRLADYTDWPDPPVRTDPLWRSWYHGGRAAEMLGNRRLLSVALRDPAPPLFGAGFGTQEREPGKTPFRWAGPNAHLVVPGLTGPPVALLAGERPRGGPTTLTVSDARSGRPLFSRRLEPGAFELALVPAAVHGPLAAPQVWVLTCDAPVPLPPFPGGGRPAQGCFTVLETTTSVPPEEIWERSAGRYLLDVGTPRDRRADLAGFHAREEIAALSLDFRWTTSEASLSWVPLLGVVPARFALRARSAGDTPVPVAVTIGGVPAGSLTVPAGDVAEVGLTLPPAAREAMSGAAPVRITLRCEARRAGPDPRELGIAVDRVLVDPQE